MATCNDPGPSGLPNYSQTARLVSSVRHSFALVINRNFAAASGLGSLSGW